MFRRLTRDKQKVSRQSRNRRRNLQLERMEDRRLLTTVDLASLMQVEGSTIYGADAGDGASIISNAGDINGDGFDDIMIQSQGADGPGNGRPDAGEASIVFGGPSLPTTIDLANLGSDGITIFGAAEGDNLYKGASAGDFNNDGFDDLIVSTGPFTQGAKSYVIFGGDSLPETIDLAAPSAAGVTIVTISSVDQTDRFSSVSGAGDVNGDGYDDVIVGAREAGAADNLKPSAGESYLIFGSEFPAETINLANLGTSGLTLHGANAGDWAGYRVRGAGDVNGDGLDEFMITAQGANNYAGEVYLIYGDTGLPGLGTIDLGQLGSAGVTIPGSSYSSGFGRGTDAAGDINGDGFDDLILTSQSDNDTYAIYGGDNLPLTIDVDNLGTGGVKFIGAYTNWAVSGAGDANGDGYDDLLIDDRDYPNAKQTYLVFGGPKLDSTIDLTNLGAGGVAFSEIEPGDDVSWVSRAGDVNGDGFADFLMGAGSADGPNNSRENAGETYLIYGGFDLWNTDVQEVFSESFEIGQWNGVWDGQNAWTRSTQRAIDGNWSAEVDGPADDATLKLSDPLDLSWAGSATLTFDWFIEGAFDSGEYLALDISTNGEPWIERARLEGDQSQEDVWHREIVDLTPYLAQSVNVRFRATVSARNEDANVDNIRIVGVPLNTEPAPRISVSPTAGLQSSEAGGTTSFDVVLDKQPTADVTIAVSSSNPAEGTVNVPSLTFTPTNWDQPQTIVVTGVDDLLEDGDVGYFIALAAASSTDPDYDGLDPADVAITNLDDDFNYAPVAVDDAVSMDQDTEEIIDVLANDSDPEGAPLTIASVGPASSGSVVLNPDQTLTYLPKADFSGTDSFTYQISDGEKTAEATVTITVRDTTVAPMFVGQISLESAKGGRYRAVFVVHDQDNQPLQGVQIQVTFAGQNYSGVTDAQGRFRTDWTKLNAGQGYSADVLDLALAGYDWNDLEDDDEVQLTP